MKGMGGAGKGEGGGGGGGGEGRGEQERKGGQPYEVAAVFCCCCCFRLMPGVLILYPKPDYYRAENGEDQPPRPQQDTRPSLSTPGT